MTVLFPRVRSKRARVTRACTAALAPLLLAAAALVPVAISNSASADPTPSDRFSCGGGAFILTSEGTIAQADSIDGTWTTLVSTGKSLNALAFNPADRYLYSMKTNQTSLQRITANGDTNLGAVSGLPAGNYPAGAIDVSTGLYYVAQENSLHAINIADLTATSVTFPSGFRGFSPDFAIANGWLWTVHSGFVTGFNLTTDEVKNYSIDRSVLPNSQVGGAMWLNSEGTTLYVQMETSGEVARFDGVGSASISGSVITSTNPVVAPIDAADCRKSTLTVTPDAKSRTYGDAAPTYTFDVTGFILGDTAGTAAGYVAPTCSSSYSSTTPVSASPLTISCSGGSADDYTFDTTATANLVVNYPTDSVNCSTDQYFRIATGTLSSGSSFLSQWIDIASMGKMKNAIAVRPADRRVYGFSSHRSNVLYRGGIFGSQALGAVSGLPAAVYVASDFDSSTGLLYVYSNKLGKLYSVDVDAMAATEVAVAAGYKFGFDIVVVNGHIWTYYGGAISSMRLSDGVVLSEQTAPGISRRVLKNKSMVGAMWYDSSTQTIYGEITSNGTLVKFSGIGSGPGGITSSLVGASTSGAIPLDGSTCS